MLPLIQKLSLTSKEIPAPSLDIAESLFLKGTQPGTPKLLILIPSKELVDQVFKVCKSICTMSGVDLSPSAAISGHYSINKQYLHNGIDILIGTPGKVMQLIEQGKVNVRQISHIVIDEADTMFSSDRSEMDPEKSFESKIDKVFRAIGISDSTKSHAQIILVCATMKRQNYKKFMEKFGKLKNVVSQNLHKIPSKLKTSFLDVGTRDKQQLFLELLTSYLQKLKSSGSQSSRTLVFCNTVKSCSSLSYFLEDSGVPCNHIHGKMKKVARLEIIAGFLDDKAEVSRRRDKNHRVLITTDIACRGIDFPRIDHVFLFDFPKDSIEYIHRCGRTARADSEGRVTALVSLGDKELATRIKNEEAGGIFVDQTNEKSMGKLKLKQRILSSKGLKRSIRSAASPTDFGRRRRRRRRSKFSKR